MTTVLLTGASGYIGKYLTWYLLEAGYEVRASVRSSAKADEVRAALVPRLSTAALIDNLHIVYLDLNADEGWLEAARGVDVIIHSASPFTVEAGGDEDLLIRPAVEGTLRALRAAKEAGVTRVIVTSSVVAIQGAVVQKGPVSYDESMWTDVTTPIGRDAYNKSKTLAERAAWDFVTHEAPEINLTTINPGLVTGAPLDGHYGTSVDVVKRVLSAKDPAMPQLAFPVVDVRDVATMHVAAIDRPATFGQRYIASGGVVSFVQLAQILKSAFPTRKVVTRQAPNWAITCLGLFDRQIRAIIPMLGKQMSFDTRAAQRDLGVSFRDPAASIVETAEFLIAEK